MASQQENRAKQEKENLETQYKHNLEIFGKQVELARETQKKQSNLTITLIVVTAISTVAASIIGAILITYLGSKEPTVKTHTTQQGLEQTSTQKNQQQNVSKVVPVQRPEKETKQSEQGESSLKNSLKKP